MPQFDRLFDNLFADKSITSTRLANFADDCHTRLTEANTGGVFTPLIGLLNPALAALQNELGDVSGSAATQKGKVVTVAQFIAGFKKWMSDKKGLIADAVGGFDSPVYLEFYPGGSSEYSTVTQTKMPTLVKRLKVMATKHAASFKTEILQKLQGFEDEWNGVSTAKQQVKAGLSTNRAERITARSSVETALYHAVHQVADRFPNDKAHCLTFFNFSLLEGTKGRTAKGDAPPKSTGA